MRKKICPKCKIQKNLNSFSYKNKKQKKKHSYCKSCHNTYKKQYVSTKDMKFEYIRWTYGLSKEEWIKLHSKFKGKCWICRVENGEVTDHCHTTNKVRGILCRHCNTGLGYFKDNTKAIANAIKYLEKSRAK